MTVPLMLLAVGAVVAGFVGVPGALGGGNAIEHFLEPSFTASAGAAHEGGLFRPGLFTSIPGRLSRGGVSV